MPFRDASHPGRRRANPVNELASGWYPQVVVVKESGLSESNGVVLRIAPDGRSTLIQSITAGVETELDSAGFPSTATASRRSSPCWASEGSRCGWSQKRRAPRSS